MISTRHSFHLEFTVYLTFKRIGGSDFLARKRELPWEENLLQMREWMNFETRDRSREWLFSVRNGWAKNREDVYVCLSVVREE